VPLWRTDALYHELKESHGTYEAAHDWWRDRYKVAADHLGLRPKVRSLGFHRLRANVAALVEWLRICFVQGWLGSPARNERGTKRGFQDRAELIKNKLAVMRVRMRVAQPYGAKAEQLQLGARTPPSRRPRGAPLQPYCGPAEPDCSVRWNSGLSERPLAAGPERERRPSPLFGN
jgi:hypothetical protein